MDRCPSCNKRMKTVISAIGRTEFQCQHCDKVESLKADAVKRADSPPAAAPKAA